MLLLGIGLMYWLEIFLQNSLYPYFVIYDKSLRRFSTQKISFHSNSEEILTAPNLHYFRIRLY